MGCENMPARTRGCPGPIHCARCIVTALLFVAKRQRTAALHLFAIDPAFVAAVFAAHRALATHRRTLLVDRAAHAVLVAGDAPPFPVARHYLPPVRGAGGHVQRAALLGHQYHRSEPTHPTPVSAQP